MAREKLIVSLSFYFEGEMQEMVALAADMGKQALLTQRLNRDFFEIPEEEKAGTLLGISLSKFISATELEKMEDHD